MLSDILILAIGITLLGIGLQAFLDEDRRKVATEVIKATFMMVTGLFLIYYWSRIVGASRGGNSSSYY
jgi:hypothetical protein